MGINCKQIEIYDYSTRDAFIQYVQKQRKPILVRGLDVGPCITKWSVEYLAETVKNVLVTVHVSPTGKMSFLKKNFTYMKLPFDEFLFRASKNKLLKPLLCENEVLYFRSISFDKRGKECSNLSKHFPSIAGDFLIPDVFMSEDFFSSVFRVSSPNMQMWLHYDVMDNILVQISGSKKVTLFSPEDIDYLYIIGDKSEVTDIQNPDIDKYPLFVNAVQYECILNPGEAIFIPALWFHTTVCDTFSINVNVFWKNLPQELYDKSDVYGNKDLLPAKKAFEHIKRAQEILNDLPEEYKKFYTRRCIADLKRNLKSISKKSEEEKNYIEVTGPSNQGNLLTEADESQNDDNIDKPQANGCTEIENRKDL